MNKSFTSPEAGRLKFRPHSFVETTTTDPVCGMQLNLREAAGSTNHNGDFRYFCSSACKLRFLEDPEIYCYPDLLNA